MVRRDNYRIQAQQAKDRFLTYDQQALAEKLGLAPDPEYFYVNLFCQPYRISRTTGDVERQVGGNWVDANTFEEVMTLLDLVCDSRPDRHPAGQWKSMEAFGLMFHRNLLENQKDPVAESFDRDPEALVRGCLALGGSRMPGSDVGFAIEVFDGLKLLLQFWRGDEEFPPRVRYLWDANALQYLKYETMYYACNLLLRRIREAAKE